MGTAGKGTWQPATSRLHSGDILLIMTPRTEAYWGYASIVSSRDVNCHDFNVAAYWMPTLDIMNDKEPLVPAAELARIVASKTIPYNDPKMIDFSDKNLYSAHMAKTTAWLLHYSLFWKQSCGLCDNAFADFLLSLTRPGKTKASLLMPRPRSFRGGDGKNLDLCRIHGNRTQDLQPR